MQLSIKNVEEGVFREFKAESAREGFPIGKSLTLAMRLWIEKQEKKPKLSMLSLKPRHWGNETRRASEDIDKALYSS